MIELSVVIPAYNPPPEHLDPTLAALRAQTLSRKQWELVVVDNRSHPPVAAEKAAWHVHGRVIREERPGLVHARAAGFRATAGAVIVVADQDNVLAPDFLAIVQEIATRHPQLGTWGAGTITPVYERPEYAPPISLHPLLTLRTAAQAVWSNDIQHHDSTPWGAGLCVRRTVAAAYLAQIEANPLRGRLDLCGERRLSGGDTDISYTGCALGLAKGVFPELRLDHLIPAGRCTAAYLEKTAADRGYSEVLHEFILTGRLPVEQRGPGAWLRELWRARRLTPLEHGVHRAHRRGRRQAIRELDPNR